MRSNQRSDEEMSTRFVTASAGGSDKVPFTPRRAATSMYYQKERSAANVPFTPEDLNTIWVRADC